MLVDSHCHLDFAEFEPDLDQVFARAHAAGVGVVQTICTHLSRFEQVLAVAKRFEWAYCSVGVHPHEAANEHGADSAALIARSRHPKVIGIGETGLDYYYQRSPRAAQITSFRAHIAAARTTGLPLIVHCRDADDEMVAILAQEAAEGRFPGLIHCFSSSPKVAEKAIEIGFYVSLAGIVTFKGAEALRTLVRRLPPDRLLVETDAPYLAPVPKRGQRNEPAFVRHTADFVADLIGMDRAAFEDQTTRNFFNLFAKAVAPAA